MANTEFDDFIKQQKAQAATPATFDPRLRLNEWLLHVEELYALVEKYLHTYIKGGDIKQNFEKLELNEDLLGAYDIKRMVLVIGLQQVVLQPVGAIIIGARGRVDIRGPKGSAKLVLVEKQSTKIRMSVGALTGTERPPLGPVATQPAELSWKFSAAPRSRELIELTSESLMTAIMEVTGA